jgi:hypothetical protein
MTKRPGDPTPDPPGGRAMERLHMFEYARRPTVDLPVVNQEKPKKPTKKAGPAKKRSTSHAKQSRKRGSKG